MNLIDLPPSERGMRRPQPQRGRMIRNLVGTVVLVALVWTFYHSRQPAPSTPAHQDFYEEVPEEVVEEVPEPVVVQAKVVDVPYDWRDVEVDSPRERKIRSMYGFDRGDKTWLDHIDSLDDDGLAPLTKYTQHYIHRHQHPPIEDCHKKKFALLSSRYIGPFQGLGSTLHILSFALRTAIENDHILAWADDPPGEDYVESSCTHDGLRSLDCLFEPLTGCPRAAITRKNSFLHDCWGEPAGYVSDRKTAPSFFTDALDHHLGLSLTPAAKKLWWRAQSTAYVSRLRPNALEFVRELRTDQARQAGFTDGGHKKLHVPFPLPPGTISMHIRHGDKYKEMALKPLSVYVAAGERLANENPISFRKVAFLSSEDPMVFVAARKLATLKRTATTPNPTWTWYHNKISRINGGPSEQLEAFGNRTETTLIWMSEAFMAIECDAFIGTRNSNWNRIIDELRCTWLDHCKQPFVEVGDEHDWAEYHW